MIMYPICNRNEAQSVIICLNYISYDQIKLLRFSFLGCPTRTRRGVNQLLSHHAGAYIMQSRFFTAQDPRRSRSAHLLGVRQSACCVGKSRPVGRFCAMPQILVLHFGCSSCTRLYVSPRPCWNDLRKMRPERRRWLLPAYLLGDLLGNYISSIKQHIGITGHYSLTVII
jgi:hypothetical protein